MHGVMRLQQRHSRVLVTLALLASIASPAVVAAEFRSIAENRTLMYDSPSAKGKKLFLADRLYPVEVVVTLDQWIKVRDVAGDIAWVERKALSDKRTVIVRVKEAALRKGADSRAAIAYRAAQNVVLEVIETAAPGWLKVRHRDGDIGFISNGDVWGS